jgi:DNA (cytosine-5)-methyltransferase 1
MRVLDLFSGCGGLTLGLHMVGGFEPVGAVEADRDASLTYTANFGVDVAHGRIEDVRDFPTAELVVGGPPCQGFSPLNRGRVGFERRALWRQYLRALEASMAEAFIMENVPALLKSAEYASFVRQATRLGFQVEGRLLNAADYGVAQTRRRAIVVGVRGRRFAWPTPTHMRPDGDQGSLMPRWRTFREAVAGLSTVPDGRNWHEARTPRATSIRRYAAVPHDGGNRFQMQHNLDADGLGHLVPRCWRDKPTGTTDVFGRVWWDRPAPTIRTEFYKPEKGRYLHPEEDRPLTLREGARCMSFPDDFRFPADQSMTAVARQIGNAVPPLLAAVLGSAVQTTFRERSHRAAA